MWGKETIKKLKVEEVRGSGWHYRAERWPPHGPHIEVAVPDIPAPEIHPLL